MAAPSTGRPVTITVGALWRFQLDSPPGPPKIPVSATLVQIALMLARVTFGVVYLNDCPQQPKIPKYLLGLALLTLLMVPFVSLPCESNTTRSHRHPTGFRVCLICLICVFSHIWILAGDVWVFSVYQPNYDPTAADGLYCDKTLYTFAFWNAVWETFVICVCLAKLCKGLLCCVLMSPVQANRDFYRNV